MATAWVMCCSIDDIITVSLWDSEQKAQEALLNELIKVIGREDEDPSFKTLDEEIIYFTDLMNNGNLSCVHSIKEHEIK